MQSDEEEDGGPKEITEKHFRQRSDRCKDLEAGEGKARPRVRPMSSVAEPLQPREEEGLCC